MNRLFIPQDLLMSLVDIGKEMNVQDEAMTRLPLWMVSDMVRRTSVIGGHDGRERREFEATDMCHKCHLRYLDNKELDDDCEECDEELFWHYSEERETLDNAGCFFTMKACQAHIDQNSYHYRDPKPFAVSVWRNPEMEMVMRFLKVIGSDVESVPEETNG